MTAVTQAQVSFTGGTYTQDFDTLVNTGTSSTVPTDGLLWRAAVAQTLPTLRPRVRQPRATRIASAQLRRQIVRLADCKAGPLSRQSVPVLSTIPVVQSLIWR